MLCDSIRATEQREREGPRLNSPRMIDGPQRGRVYDYMAADVDLSIAGPLARGDLATENVLVNSHADGQSVRARDTISVPCGAVDRVGRTLDGNAGRAVF